MGNRDNRHSRHHNNNRYERGNSEKNGYRNDRGDRNERENHRGKNDREFHGQRDRSESKSFSNKPVFHSTTKAVTIQQINEEEEAIRAFKGSNQMVCAKCGVAISDISCAITARSGEGTIHFDCAIEELSGQEKLEDGDKITYIGQGRFGIVHHANPHDMKHFTIKKIIDWENKESKPDWRNEMAELYSHVR